MARTTSPSREAPFLNVSQAGWVVRALTMLIAVVGRDSLLGLILRQARSEITSVVQPDEPGAARAGTKSYINN
jgi:hypothetical protein